MGDRAGLGPERLMLIRVASESARGVELDSGSVAVGDGAADFRELNIVCACAFATRAPMPTRCQKLQACSPRPRFYTETRDSRIWRHPEIIVIRNGRPPKQGHGKMQAARRAVLQLVGCSVLMVAMYVVTSPQPRALLSYPEQPAEAGAGRENSLAQHSRWSSSRNAEFRSLKRQGDGEVDFDVTHAPLDEQVSNMDVSMQFQQPKAPPYAARKAAIGGLTAHHVVVDGVSASWARKPRARAAALQKAAPGRTQELSSAYPQHGIGSRSKLLERRVTLASTASPLGERVHTDAREEYDIAKARDYAATSPDEEVSSSGTCRRFQERGIRAHCKRVD